MDDYNAQIVQTGWSFGAYDDGACIGVIIAELQNWNKIVMVREFHVAEAYRREGIGAISAYRRLGFRMAAIDISLYANEDYPDKEMAVFMKHRL